MDIAIRDDGTISVSDFNALQAFKIARKLERDGIAFYRQVLGQAKEAAVSHALRVLLDSEEEHAAFFEEKITLLQAESDDGFEDEDIADFMDAHIFTRAELTQRHCVDFSNAASVVEYGIVVELKSIAFYTALLENTSDDNARAAISEIIGEEQKHLETLKELV